MLKRLLQVLLIDNIFRRLKSAVLPLREDVDTGSIHPSNQLRGFLETFNKKTFLLIILGTSTWVLTMVKSGLTYSFGMGFWGPNGHDGIWHIALANSLARGSWQIPVFAGEAIKNYHIGFDLILAMLHKLTFIPIHTLYFQIIPPILALGIGLFVYLFILTWKNSKSAAFWATFFVYFGGNFGWIVTLLRDKEIGGESLFWAQQSISTLINPPFALSLMILFAGLYSLVKATKQKGQKNSSTTYYLLSTFLFGVLVQIKVYAGLLSLAALLVAGVVRMLEKRNPDIMKVFAGASVISILLFSPVTRAVEETLILRPFWFLETMMGAPDRIGWQRFYDAMVNYRLGGVWLKAILAYLTAFLIFLVGNMGTRIVGWWLVFGGWWRRKRNFASVDVFIFTVITAGVVVPMFYVQSGTAWNSLQFFYYSLMFSGIIAGVVLGEWLDKIKTSLLYSIEVVAIIILTVPTAAGTLGQYLPARPPAKISHEELDALKFLSSQPEGVVLTLPFNKDAAQAAVDKPPRSLYLYESTAYVSAFSGKKVYLEDEVNLDITGYSWKKRREKVKAFFENPNKEFLEENKINYVYLVKEMTGKRLDGIELEMIFGNNTVDIYKTTL